MSNLSQAFSLPWEVMLVAGDLSPKEGALRAQPITGGIGGNAPDGGFEGGRSTHLARGSRGDMQFLSCSIQTLVCE